MLFKIITIILISPIILLSEVFNLVKPEVYIAPETKTVVVNDTANQQQETPQNVEKETKIEEKITPTKEKQEPVAKTEKKTRVISKEIEVPKANTEPTPDFGTINTEARKTIVNILCTTKYNDLSPISGTGVVISSDGLILTNAHIGQYFLLKDFREKDYIKCIARTGSPAYPSYDLELVYISPNWVNENKAILKEQNPKGTGENDFAFLRITGKVNSSEKPQGFTYIQPNTSETTKKGDPVLLISYPAGFLGGISIIQNLYITSAITSVEDVYTFSEDRIDLLSVGGTVVSQKGSSGGLVVDKNTSLVGIITTSSDGDTTSSRGLNAITLSYINNTFQKESGISLSDFLRLDHTKFASTFNETESPILTKLIVDELISQ